MPWTYDDADYAHSGFRAKHGNDVVIAIAIATAQPYGTVYNELYNIQCDYVNGLRHGRIKDKGAAISEVGIWPEVSKRYLRERGWTWVPIMKIGSGTTVHLTYEEVPDEPVMLLSVSRSLVVVINGVVRATHDPSRDGTRAVYGYWTPPRD
jgi:hypothetical protein